MKTDIKCFEFKSSYPMKCLYQVENMKNHLTVECADVQSEQLSSR
jgi:hypothetical protein